MQDWVTHIEERLKDPPVKDPAELEVFLLSDLWPRYKAATQGSSPGRNNPLGILVTPDCDLKSSPMIFIATRRETRFSIPSTMCCPNVRWQICPNRSSDGQRTWTRGREILR